MNHGQLVRHKLRNNLQSLGLLALLALLLGLPAWVIGGEPLLWGTLLGVLILAVTNPAVPPRLLMSLYRVRSVRPGAAPGLYRLVDALTQRAGLARVPQLYYLPSATVNAFATGRRDDAVILVSDGLLRRLDWRELAAVLAHEVAHIAHEDIRVMALADLVSRIAAALSLAGQLLLLLVLPALVLGMDELPWFPILILLSAPTLSALCSSRCRAESRVRGRPRRGGAVGRSPRFGLGLGEAGADRARLLGATVAARSTSARALAVAHPSADGRAGRGSARSCVLARDRVRLGNPAAAASFAALGLGREPASATAASALDRSLVLTTRGARWPTTILSCDRWLDSPSG